MADHVNTQQETIKERMERMRRELEEKGIGAGAPEKKAPTPNRNRTESGGSEMAADVQTAPTFAPIVEPVGGQGIPPAPPIGMIPPPPPPPPAAGIKAKKLPRTSEVEGLGAPILKARDLHNNKEKQGFSVGSIDMAAELARLKKRNAKK